MGEIYEIAKDVFNLTKRVEAIEMFINAAIEAEKQKEVKK